jgi:hypothetical protein
MFTSRLEGFQEREGEGEEEDEIDVDIDERIAK